MSQTPNRLEPAGPVGPLSGWSKDPWLLGGFAVLIVSVLPYSLRWMDPQLVHTYGEWWITLPITAFAVIVLAARAWSAKHPREMRFWRLWAIAFGLWTLGLSVTALLPTHLWDDMRASLSVEAIYTADYLCLVISLELHPLRSTEDLSRRLKAFEATGGLILVFAAIFYFMFIPLNFSPESFDFYAPSLLMYIVMDAYLMFRLVALSGSARGSLQPKVYLLLAAAMGCNLVADLYEYLSWSEFVPWVSGGTPLDWLWLAPAALVVLAARLKPQHDAPYEVVMPAMQRHLAPPKPGLLVAYAGAFPFLHVLLYRLDLLDETTEQPRLLAAIVAMLLLSGLAVTFQRLLDEERNRLEADRLLETRNKGTTSKMEALGRMASGISHDFNNLLTVISGSQEVVKRKTPEDVPVHDWLDEIGNAAERAKILTQQLLAFSRQLPSKPIALCVNSIVRANERTVRTLLGARIEFVSTDDGSSAWVKIDPTQLQRVLLNLAANSRDAMPDGGRFEVHCSTRVLDSDEAESRSLAPGDYVTLEVSDTGSGLEEATTGKIFEPFFTTKKKGTGLGLAASFGILQRSGGHIEADNRDRGGALFTVLLPAVDEPEQDPDTAPLVLIADTAPQPATLLLAEDEIALRKLMAHMLAEYGYTILEAGSGEEALEVAEAFDSPIDLLLTDVLMPGMSGTDLALQILARRPETRVAYLSGNPKGRTLATQGIHAGVPFLSKPFDSSTLVEFVDNALAHGPTQPSLD